MTEHEKLTLNRRVATEVFGYDDFDETVRNTKELPAHLRFAGNDAGWPTEATWQMEEWIAELGLQRAYITALVDTLAIYDTPNVLLWEAEWKIARASAESCCRAALKAVEVRNG